MCVWLCQSPTVAQSRGAGRGSARGNARDALRPNTRSAPATAPKKSLHVRFWCGHRTVPGREPMFSKRVPIARKGSRTVPYSHLISAISLTLLFNGRGPLHRWRRVCNRRRGPRRRLHSAPVAPRRNQVFAKVKRRSATTPYTHDARNTRRTTHAVPLAGKAWRQSLHRSLMAASGRHSGPGHEASSAQSSCEPTKPPPQPPRAGTPLGATTTQRMAIRRTRCLAARRLSANNGVTPKVPSSATADGAMTEIQEWRRDRALGSGAAPALFAGARLSRQRGAARQRDAPRGGINAGKVEVVFSIGDNSADAHSSLMQCPERDTPKRKCQNQSFRFSSH